MRRKDLRRLFSRAKALIGETDFVVIGSLAALGHPGKLPRRMAMSVDVDAYAKSDPGRIFDLAGELGQGSRFDIEYGFYLDPVSSSLASLPAGWKDRLVRVELERGLRIWFLEPNDAAVSKYARMEPRDREWIRAGLAAGIVSLAKVKARSARTVFFDDAEARRAREAIEEDRAWLGQRKRRRTPR